MRTNYLKVTLNAAILAVIILLAAGVSSAQIVNLTASQQTVVLPDGNSVPMWGWTCGTVTQGTTAGTSCTALTYNTATGALNAQLGGTVWQPPLIVVPSAATTAGASLTISLTNTLPVETSIVIIGQVSGGFLGSPVREAGPRTDGAHAGQTSTTWTIVNPGSFTPPTQGARARSFVTEVAGVPTVGTAAAMGTYSWTGLQPGTYLIRTGTYPSIQGPMGLYGVLVVTKPPAAGAAGLAYPVTGSTAGGVTYDADVVALESEMDPRQNKMVAALFPTGGAAGSATANAGFDETLKWNPGCGAGANGLTSSGAAPTCYPPAVDYTPLYFFVNGVAFNKDNRPASALSVPAAGTTGNILVRLVNAGSHMHVPSVDGLHTLLVAEDGYVLPDIALALGQNKTLTAKNGAAAPATAAAGLRLQDEVFQAAGKVFDVLVSPPQTGTNYNSATYAISDRSLDLSTDNQRDGGMLAFLDVNDAGAAKLAAANSSVTVNADHYAYAPGVRLTVSDPGRGVVANDVNVYGVQLSTTTPATSANGTLTLYPNGTFTYVPSGSAASDAFTYCANGTTTTSTPSFCTSVTLNLSATANAANAPHANPDSYTSNVASILRVAAPGVLQNDVDTNGFPLTAVFVTKAQAFVTVFQNADGSFTVTKPATSLCPVAGCTFTYQAKNSQNILSNTATVTLNFPTPSNLSVTVRDANTKVAISDYKWIIEQDLTFPINPACQVNTGTAARPAGCPALPAGSVAPPTPATNFHTSFFPVIAEGCTGPKSCEQGQTVYDANPASPTYQQHVQAACDGYGICTVGATQLPASFPIQAHLAATNPDGTPASYYISILPGDSTNAFNTGNTKDPTNPANCAPGTQPTGITTTSSCGHVMGGAPIPVPATCTANPCTFAPVVVNLQQNPLPTATVTAYVFEDDYPLNGEPDTGGGVDTLATQEVPLGDFQIILWDTAGGIGDNTGQMTYDMFNVPLTNALNGTIDPSTGLDACPISQTQPGVGIGVIIVCPQFESDGKTPSPLTGQAVIKNLMQGKFAVTPHPGATREANGEEWHQTNTLDGGPKLDSFIKPGEPAYFQEFGPGGFHVFFGMANPKHINARLKAICGGTTNPGIPFAPPCRNHINGQVSNLHQARSPNEQLYSGGVFSPGTFPGDPRNYAMLGYTNCYAALGDSDGATIAFAKCDPDGNFNFDTVNASGVPDGDYGLVVFDQWDDVIVDGSSRAVNVTGGQTKTLSVPYFTWQTHLWNRTYMDVGQLGRPVLLPDGSLDPVLSPGLLQVPTRIRQRNGKFVNTLLSDIGGNSRFDETFPLFNWYTVESDTTRFRDTGVHVVNDAGGQVDGPAPVGNGTTTGSSFQGVLNSKETFPLPTNLRVPGAYYCSTADCTDSGSGKPPVGGPGGTTARIDPGSDVVEGWQGGVSQFDIMDWGKIPYAANENGGIRGHVVNATTRPFDDPQMTFQNLWEPLVPNVTMNLYKESTAPDGTTSLTLVDTTQTTSWDSWAQGFGSGARAGIPNMNCPGQDPTTDPFFTYTLSGTRNYLSPGTAPALPNSSQYKCYDSYHNLNQAQPAVYDGLYQFPSQSCLTGATFTVAGNTTPYNCATITNPAASQTGAAPKILTPGTYVTEMVLPPGWQLSKEEDLNLLIGDQYIAPVASQFGGLGNIFIVPDQAILDSINPSYSGPYTAASGVNGTSGPYTPPFGPGGTPLITNNGKPSTNLGRTSFGSFGPGGNIQQSAPCVGLMRIVPDYLSISPESGEIAPFAGSLRRLCDRKEITLDNQMQANADFFIYTMTPKATTFTGFISDDFSSEFDPASPAFGEKFAIPNVPVSIRDSNGAEVSRVYSDQWGIFNGLVYSTWEVDPPNPTGYSPNMMVTCMNDPGPIPDPLHAGQFINDPYYNPAYSVFCYENPFMPGDAAYLDTPVVPVSAFAEGYNPPDCAYPDTTPMIKSVLGDAIGGNANAKGPWVSLAGHSLTINAVGDQVVPDHAYSGPAASTAPYNQKTVTRHYGFGTGATVTIGGVAATCSGSDLQMTCTVPPTVPLCNVAQPSGPKCGELVVRAANGRQSIDAITVTVGGKTPTFVPGPNTTNNAIQNAIDSAAPGDLIIVGCAGPVGTTPAQTSCIYNEMVIMWQPVQLQGIGDGAVTLNANTHPAGKLLEPWRRKVNCLFGLALNGGFINNNASATNPNGTSAYNPYDPNGAFPTEFPSGECPFYGSVTGLLTTQSIVDPLMLEPVVGWDATLNGNIAELLQEPTLMGAYEGGGITVVAKGLENNNTANCNPIGNVGCIPLNALTGTTTNNGFNNGLGDCNPSSLFYRSNFLCNRSRIDGLTITNSSQGGGGIFVHGWAHNLEIANTHVTANGGTLTGGITIGQMETADPTLVGTVAQALAVDTHVNVHHNSVTSNAAYGDELNSNTPASAGGVTFCTGSDNYRFNFNWVCGNWSSGDGGGFSHHGFIWNGEIGNNWFVFNQSINPSLVTNGGGVAVLGAAPDGATPTINCENAAVDFDCPPALSDGTGPGLRIHDNVFQGNTSEEGSGGGLALLHVNGNDILNNPSTPGTCRPGTTDWYCVSITNNIFANNVAGWTGGGVSLLDAVVVNFTNNTVASNDSTASAGVVFDSLGAPNGNIPPPGNPTAGGTPCDPNNNPSCTGSAVTTSQIQPAGLVTEHHSANLARAFTNPSVVCPTGHAQCTTFSNPVLDNDVFWQNRSFYITAAPVVQLNPVLTQGTTGACTGTGSPTYWDIGVYNDTSATNHQSGLTLTPTHSIITSGYNGNGNRSANPGFGAQYCNGSRVPPEIAPALCSGTNGHANAQGCIQPGTVGVSMTVPGGVPDSLTPPLPAFTLTPAATIDEGSNWINMFYGPLSLSNATLSHTTNTPQTPLGNYNHTGASGANLAPPYPNQ